MIELINLNCAVSFLVVLSCVLTTLIPKCACLPYSFQSKVAHSEFLAIPSDLPVAKLNADVSFSVDEPTSLDHWTLHGEAAMGDNDSVILAPNEKSLQGSIFSSSNIPATSINWRIEAVFSALKTYSYSAKDKGAPGFGFFVASKPSISSAVVDDHLDELQGFLAWMALWYDDRLLVASYEKQSTKSFNVYEGNLQNEMTDQCISLTANQTTDGVLIIAQCVKDKITVSLLALDYEGGGASPISCYVDLPLDGFSELIASGSMAVGMGGYNQGFFAESRVHSLSFFSLEPEPTTTTTTTTTTETPTTTTEAIEYYAMPVLVPGKVPKPELPPERSIPKFVAKRIQENCLDFASNISAPPNNNKPTLVYASFIIENFLGVDDVDETISVTATLFLQWFVTTCPAASASGLRSFERVFVAKLEDVWRPVVIFRSSPTDVYMKSDQFGDDLVVTVRPGRENLTFAFLWTRIGIFKSKCELNLRKFPFDYQECGFDFSLQRTSLLVQFGGIEMEQPDSLSEIGEWQFVRKLEPKMDFIDSTAMKSNSSRAVFKMALQRKPDYFAFNLLAPNLVLTLMELGAFLIPPALPERSTFAVTILLALTVAQSDVLKMVPKSTQRILLADYILLLTVFTGGCTIYDMAICAYAHLKIGRKRMAICCAGYDVSISVVRFLDAVFFLVAVASLGIINYYAANLILNLD